VPQFRHEFQQHGQHLGGAPCLPGLTWDLNTLQIFTSEGPFAGSGGEFGYRLQKILLLIPIVKGQNANHPVIERLLKQPQ
jgi:hypothetical protein